ncbi:hypothetical protein TCE0_043f15767 [Talaromyces pinophilus]|uniref:Uncharacterized protein n=1 Tax=Talaromyces pinophilus TaxID=128442 RepID=A0A0B8N1M9_TALPI|nr:hypothetical protein TCE0_043f15767 [Talaromyces pinophilus]
MVSLWPWKGEDTSPASFEKTLSTLSTKATETNTQLDKLRQQARRFKALWTLYSVFIYLLYSTIDVLVLGWQNWGIYTVRTVASRMFDYRINRSQNYLDSLNKQRDETIEKLKVATKYNSTQQLLEKYGGESPKPKSTNKNGGTKKKDNNIQQRKTAGNVPERTGIPPPPTANIRRYPQNDVAPSLPYNQPRPSPRNEKPLPPPPSTVATYTDQPGFAPNAFPPSAQPQYAAGGTPKWYDRLMDVIADIQREATEGHGAAHKTDEEKSASEDNDDGELIKKEEEEDDEEEQSEKEEETQKIPEKTGTTQSESQPQSGVETRSRSKKGKK